MNAMPKSVVCMAALAAVRMAFGAAAYGPNLEDLTVARDATVAIDAVSYYGNAGYYYGASSVLGVVPSFSF